jgi:hypothetical protein
MASVVAIDDILTPVVIANPLDEAKEPDLLLQAMQKGYVCLFDGEKSDGSLLLQLVEYLAAGNGEQKSRYSLSSFFSSRLALLQHPT